MKFASDYPVTVSTTSKFSNCYELYKSYLFIVSDVYHWVCLDTWARSLPNDTAPAGYTCQTCHECIFPAENLVSPIADALRKLLSDVNWARPGLGLPLLDEKNEVKPHFSFPVGPRPQPEGESVNGNSAMKDGAIPKYPRLDLKSYKFM